MKGYLFDTSALLWSVIRSERLNSSQRAIVGSRERYVSQVCAIEIAIKFSIGRLALPPEFTTDFAGAFQSAADDLRADVLAVSMDDIDRLSRLPLLHRDPFDRLIIAQALGRDLTVVTGDRVFSSYSGLDILRI